MDLPRQPVLSRFRRHVVRNWPAETWKSALTVVAVSGGPDSVALLRVLHSLFGELAPDNQLVVAHVNHKTQLENSDRDADFVKRLASQLDLECHLAPCDRRDDGSGLSEQALREARYGKLRQIADKIGARYIATAHNRDDQIETVLFRIVRGTGLPGLVGIPRFRQVNDRLTLVRPLLDLSRLEILELLAELDQDYCVDVTNSRSDYSRNFLRNEVIPKIKERFGATFEGGMLRLSRQAGETQSLLHELCSSFDSAIETTADRILADRKALAGQSPVLIRHKLVTAWDQQGWPRQDMTARHWSRLGNFICRSDDSAPFMLPGNVRVQSIGNKVVIDRP
jgi:tRNA(Ile)-lysidine synthase